MRTLKNLFSQLHIYVLWLLLSVFFWGWIFTLITDTKPEHKVTIFAETYALEDTALAEALSASLPEGIRMVKVHPFSYAMFEESTIRSADLFIVRASKAPGYIDSFAPLTLDGEGESLQMDGRAYGVRIYDAASGYGAAEPYITYLAPGEEPEDFYLFFGADSLHTGEKDDAAILLAKQLLHLDEGGTR